MNSRLRNAIVVVGVALYASSSTSAQQPQAQSQDHEAHHQDMLARGAQVMGFDQERTVHHFLLYEDGGAIDVSAKDGGDQATLQAVRQHLHEIAGSFTAGDFGKPALIHAQQVPGTATMTQRGDHITYQYEETSTGGRVRIVTRDPEALAAVHAFLQFQIEDHRTGDPGLMQRPGASGMMNGMGPGMMGHDGALMTEMSAIHELFINHDRITRTVTNLPDGIRTVTESSDPHTAQILKEHVASMDERVERGNDPGLPIESQALHSIFQHHDQIHTTIETTETGIVVVQTSTDPDLVAALQQHALEVTDFVKDGMAAMGRMMMTKGGGMMRAGPNGQADPSPR